MEVFVAQFDLGILAPDRNGRIDAVALEIDVIPEAAGLLIHRVDTACDIGIDRSAGIDRNPLVVVRSALDSHFADRPAIRFLGNAIDNATAAAAAEDQRIRALEHFNALNVVEVTIVLDVVAHAINKEIG